MQGSSALVQELMSAASGDNRSAPAWLAVGGCSWALGRRCWRALCSGRLYLNVDNWLGLALGHGLDHFVGDVRLVQVAALVAAVIAKVIAALRSYKKLRKQFKAFVLLLRRSFLEEPSTQWLKKPSSSLLSPSVQSSWSQFVRRESSYLLSLASRSAQLTCSLFDCLNQLAGIADALSWDPEANQRNVREAFLNLDTSIAQWVTNGQALVEFLEGQKKVLESLLCSSNAPFDANTFIQTVAQATGVLESVHVYTDGLKRHCGDLARDTLEIGVCSAAMTLGYGEMVQKESWSEQEQELLSLPYPLQDKVCLLSCRKKIEAEKLESLGKSWKEKIVDLEKEKEVEISNELSVVAVMEWSTKSRGFAFLSPFYSFFGVDFQ